MRISQLWVRRLNFIALLLATFLAPYLLFGISFLFEQVPPLNDVLLYGYWLQQMQLGEPLFGLTQDFVYPYPSLLPMWLAQLIGGPAGILVGWTTLVAVLNAFAIGSLTSWGKGGRGPMLAGVFWVVFLLLLGPSGIGRIDAVAAAVSVLGLAALARERIALAIALFSFGAWIKIWPFGLAVSKFVADKRKQVMALTALVATAAVLIFAIAAGANDSLFSFVFKQGNRGIQVESPIAMIWIWSAKLGAPDTGIYYDKEIITNQVYGPLVNVFSSLMTPIMFAALGITVWLGIRAIKAGAEQNQVFAIMSLTAVLDLIVFNKVGSPQFMAWLAIPMIALIIFKVPRLKIPAIALLIIAAITNLIYPIFYIDLMGLGDLSVGLLTARNALLIGILVYANLRLSELTRK
ncbi:MAG: hypothetical protein RL343_887 [Actinomycetota bacterium]